MRKTVQKLAFGLLLAAGLNANAQMPIPTNGLQLYYKFDGNLNDHSGNGNHATSNTFYNYIHTGLSSTTDSCFVGTGNYDLHYDYTSNVANINVQNFSCFLWVKFDNIPNLYTNFMENGSGLTNNQVYFRLLKTDGGTNVRMQAGYYSASPSASNYSEYTLPISSVVDDNWHLFVFTSEIVGTNRISKLYFDGNLKKTDIFDTDITIDYPSSYSKLNIGHRDGATNFGIYGGINDFAYYNRALSDSEVAELYSTTTGINDVAQNNITAVYPNPTNNILHIEVKDNTNIKIINMLGATVATQKLQTGNNTVDVSGLTKGIYFIHNSTGGAVKFIKD